MKTNRDPYTDLYKYFVVLRLKCMLEKLDGLTLTLCNISEF